MRLMITGARGMLGCDVVRAAAERGHDVVAYVRAALDITDRDAVAAAVAYARPAAVINCAAWTDVDGAESDETAALAVNGAGPGILAAAAASAGSQLVHVSSDYVFDGRASAPYVESDPVGPVSAYGRTKLAGEQAVLEAGGGHAVVRSSWLFGVDGRNFVATMLGLADSGREEVAVVIDQVGCPTFTGHLAPALIELAEGGAAGIHHIAGSGHCSWHELANETFCRAGVDVRVLVAKSEDMPRAARRPSWSVLGSERADPITLAPWRDGVAAYLEQVGRMPAR